MTDPRPTQIAPWPALLSVAQAARYLGLGQKRLRRMVQERRIPHTWHFGKLQFPRAALDRAIERGTIAPVGDGI